MPSFVAAIFGFLLYWLSGFDQSERGLVRMYVRVAAVLAFVASVFLIGYGPSHDGAGCFTDWDGRSNHRVCR